MLRCIARGYIFATILGSSTLVMWDVGVNNLFELLAATSMERSN